jgi:hypothetical protein
VCIFSGRRFRHLSSKTSLRILGFFVMMRAAEVLSKLDHVEIIKSKCSVRMSLLPLVAELVRVIPSVA